MDRRRGSIPGVKRIRDQSRELSSLYGEVFALFHRRVAKRASLTPESWAVLEHFRLAGPLTVTEAGRHMDRAQSVMSEIIDRLERKGLLRRLRDERDRRRVLVWLTPAGQARLAQDAQILDEVRLARALARMPPAERMRLLTAIERLLKCAAMRPNHRRTGR
jgi:DNA-binding MarR family transcriptional regulator